MCWPLEQLVGRCVRCGPQAEPCLLNSICQAEASGLIELSLRGLSGATYTRTLAPEQVPRAEVPALRRETFLVRVGSCPLCGAAATEAEPRFHVAQLFWEVAVIECPRCGLVYKSEFPTDLLLSSIYGQNYTHFAKDQDPEANIARQRNRLRRLGRPRGRHLDYGCGAGYFVESARRAGWSSVGCDPFLPDHRVGGPRSVDFLRGDVLEKDTRERLGTFDAITLWAVIEHLPALGQVLAALVSLLRPDGFILLNFPHGQSLAARRSGRQWCRATLLEHLLFLTPRSVQWISSRFGLRIRKLVVCGAPYPIGKGGTGSTAQGLRSLPFDCLELPTGPAPASPEPGAGQRSRLARTLMRLASAGESDSLREAFLRRLVGILRIGDHIEAVLSRP